MTYTLRSTGLLAASAALSAALSAQQSEVVAQSFGSAGGRTPMAAAVPELSWNADGGAIEMRGGSPEGAAMLVVGTATTRLPSPLGTILVADGIAHVLAFDERGVAALPFATGAVGACWFVQGAVLDEGGGLQGLSNGLRLDVVEVLPNPASIDDSGLRFRFPFARSDELEAALAERDLDSAIMLALDSSGDELEVEIGGTVGVPVFGATVGGKVTLRATLSRTDDCFEIAIEREVAVTLGVEATKDVGISGGYGAAMKQVYAFATAGEAARGLRQIALIQALGAYAVLANDDALAMVQRARRALAAARATRDAFVRAGGERWLGPRMRRALDAALTRQQRALARCNAAADALEDLYATVVEARAAVREHRAGAEVRLKAVAEVSLQVDGRALGKVGGEFTGERTVAVRVHRHGDARVHKVGVRVFQQMAGEASASATVGELTATRRIEVGCEFVRGDDGWTPTGGPTLTITRDYEAVSRSVAKAGQVGAGVELQLVVDLGATGSDLLEAVLAGDTGPLADLTATVRAQGRLLTKAGGEPGFGVAGAKLELALGLTWKDCGRAHEATLRCGDVLTAIASGALVSQALDGLAAAR